MKAQSGIAKPIISVESCFCAAIFNKKIWIVSTGISGLIVKAADANDGQETNEKLHR
jgi:hypothetical protein